MTIWGWKLFSTRAESEREKKNLISSSHLRKIFIIEMYSIFIFTQTHSTTPHLRAHDVMAGVLKTTYALNICQYIFWIFSTFPVYVVIIILAFLVLPWTSHFIVSHGHMEEFVCCWLWREERERRYEIEDKRAYMRMGFSA